MSQANHDCGPSHDDDDDPFAEVARLIEVARARVMPTIPEGYLVGFFDARFGQLRRDVEFIDYETRRFR